MDKINEENIEKNSNEKNNDNLDDITDVVLSYATIAYQQELDREKSLIHQSGQMVAYFSFVSIFLATLLPVILTVDKIPAVFISLIATIIFLLQFASMVIAVIVQWRFKYSVLSSPMDTFNHILKNKNSFKEKRQQNKSFVETLDAQYKVRKKINDKRAKLITASMILFFISIGIVVVSTIFMIMLYFCEVI
jgi:hypothetical protein